MSQLYSRMQQQGGRRVFNIDYSPRNPQSEEEIEELIGTLDQLSTLQNEVFVWIEQLADKTDEQMKICENVGVFGNLAFFSGTLITLAVPWLKTAGMVGAVAGRCVATGSDIAKLIIDFLADSNVQKKLGEHTHLTRRAVQLFSSIQRNYPTLFPTPLGESYGNAYNTTTRTRSVLEPMGNWDCLLLAMLAYAGKGISIGIPFSAMTAGHSLYNRIDMSKESETGMKLRQLARELRLVSGQQSQLCATLRLLLSNLNQ